MHWQSIQNDREKYAAYLCSREWSVLKEAVKSRSGGICERCRVNKMDHVHHLTYSRKYSERLEDLQACCKKCHDFIHGKSQIDPALRRSIQLPQCKSNVKSFYLAGKITGDCWRDSIIENWSTENGSRHYSDAFFEYSEHGSWAVVADAVTVCGTTLDYTGPWWMDPHSGGHSVANDTAFPHGYGSFFESVPDLCDGSDSRKKEVFSAIKEAITLSDMVFAWIDSADCYGTIFELGYARALGKVIVVAMSDRFAVGDGLQMWLIHHGSYFITAKNPAAAWRQFWDAVSTTAQQQQQSVYVAGWDPKDSSQRRRAEVKLAEVAKRFKTSQLSAAEGEKLLNEMVALRRASVGGH